MRLLKTIHRGWKAYDFNPFSQMASRWWWLREEVCPYKSLFRRQVCHHPGDSCRSLCAEWLVHTEIYGPNSLHFTQTLMFHLAILCPMAWWGAWEKEPSRCIFCCSRSKPWLLFGNGNHCFYHVQETFFMNIYMTAAYNTNFWHPCSWKMVCLGFFLTLSQDYGGKHLVKLKWD